MQEHPLIYLKYRLKITDRRQSIRINGTCCGERIYWSNIRRNDADYHDPFREVSWQYPPLLENVLLAKADFGIWQDCDHVLEIVNLPRRPGTYGMIDLAAQARGRHKFIKERLREFERNRLHPLPHRLEFAYEQRRGEP